MSEVGDAEETPEITPINIELGEQAERFSGFVIVRLDADQVPAESWTGDSLIELANAYGLQDLVDLLDEVGQPQSRRLINRSLLENLPRLEATARENGAPLRGSLADYWRIDLRNSESNIEEFAARLNELSVVASAYAELTVSGPGVFNASSNTRFMEQGYLLAAPQGINAPFAWGQTGGGGAGVGFTILEQGWLATHEELQNKPLTHLFGDNTFDHAGRLTAQEYIESVNHGTAALGIVLAENNLTGIVGVAADNISTQIVSYYNATDNSHVNVAEAIITALPSMTAGDVLLLEAQRDFRPVEVDEADFHAIQTAVGNGMIVIEPAGNGGHNIDDLLAEESGAIMVGAMLSNDNHNRQRDSNYGTRVNCSAWGENVTTCGYIGTNGALVADDPQAYTAKFGGTSSAAAIIAVVSLLVQAVAQANGQRLSACSLRELLRDPNNGIVSQIIFMDRVIGPMPNLEAILTNVLAGTIPHCQFWP